MESLRVRRRIASLDLVVLLAMMFALGYAVTASAQVVSDPRVAEFSPSPDHWGVLENGQPAVLRYELGMYLVGASAPFTTFDLGKPPPDGDGKIRYQFSSGVAGWPVAFASYEARVSAVGQEGEALSEPSNHFTFTTGSTCSFALGAATVQVPAKGGALGVDVSTSDGCGWTATTSLPWVTLWTASGSGRGTVPFEVGANSSTTHRTGTLTIGGQTLTLAQYGVENTSATAGAATHRLTVARPSGGTVKAAGINCGTTGTSCAVTMPASMNIGLEAAPDASFRFTGWTGDCAGSSAGYLLHLNGLKTCGANFAAIPTVPPSSSSTNTSSGTSTGSPTPGEPSVLPLGGPYTLTFQQPAGGVVRAAGITCGTTRRICTVTMPGPMRIGIHAVADSGYVFLGWTGQCSGADANLLLALDGPRACGASFAPVASAVIQPAPPTAASAPSGILPMGAPYTLTVTRPTGGRINAAGIDCGTTGTRCSVTMPASLRLGLEVAPDPGYIFTGWTGHCGGPQPIYLLALEGPRTCSATFAKR